MSYAWRWPYVVVSWLLLQLTDVLIPLFTLPEWVGRLVFLLLLIGLPLALFFAWAFELTPEGVKKEKDVDRSQSITHSTGRKLDFVIIAVLVFALALFAADKFIPDSGPATDNVAEVTTTAIQQSIAVLPFVNMSSDPEQEYFSDGLSEELLNLLAKIPELKVIGRTSSFAFKGKNEDLRGIGEALGVNTVLEGSVRKSGERVRITAQLIDVSDGAHIWSETYDRTMTDVFEIQDNVAAEIIDALKVHVGVMPERGRPTDSTQAYTLFLKARAMMNDWKMAEAAKTLKSAVELDPGFAEAYELLAYAYWNMAGTIIKSGEGQILSAAAAADALAINPDLVLAQSLYSSGTIETYSFLGEIEGLERAARLEPAKTASLDMLAYDLCEAGYMQEALDAAEQYVALDPLSANAHLRMHNALYGVGRVDEAMESLETAHQLGDLGAFGKSAHLVIENQDEEAIPHLEEILAFYEVPVELAAEFIAGGRDPATGPAFLDEIIPRIIGMAPDDQRNDFQRMLVGYYNYFGHFDRLFEIILDIDMDASTWTAADDMLTTGACHQLS